MAADTRFIHLLMPILLHGGFAMSMLPEIPFDARGKEHCTDGCVITDSFRHRVADYPIVCSARRICTSVTGP
jgi:hypothetical protein